MKHLKGWYQVREFVFGYLDNSIIIQSMYMLYMYMYTISYSKRTGVNADCAIDAISWET